MYLSTWIILLGSVCTTFFVAFTKVREHSEDEMRVLVGEGTANGLGGPGAAGGEDAEIGKEMRVGEGEVKSS